MKTVEILGKTYVYTEGPSAPGDGSMGRQNSKEQTIWVNSEMGREAKQSTLVHEFVHAVSDHLGLDLTEAQVRGLETALFAAGFVVNVATVGDGGTKTTLGPLGERIVTPSTMEAT